MQPLIFLDVDGVLNTLGWNKKAAKKYPDVAALLANPLLAFNSDIDTWAHMIDPVRVARVQTIADQTGAGIVISSSWRERHELRDLREMFLNKGLTAEIVGATPLDAYYHNAPAGDSMRGMEIEQWLLRYIPRNCLAEQRFVILDDENDMGRLRSHLIQTSWYKGGLMDKHVRKAVRVLQSDPPGGFKVATEPNKFWSSQSFAKLYRENVNADNT